MFFKKLIKKLIDKYTSGIAPSHFIYYQQKILEVLKLLLSLAKGMNNMGLCLYVMFILNTLTIRSLIKMYLKFS